MPKTTKGHVIESFPLDFKYEKRAYNFDFLLAFKDQESAIDLCDVLQEKCIGYKTTKNKKVWCLALGVALSYFEKAKILDKDDVKVYNENYSELCKATHCDKERETIRDITEKLITSASSWALVPSFQG